MKRRLSQLLARYDALSLRERVIVATLLVLVLVIGWQEIFYSSQSREQKRLRAELGSIQSRTAAQQQQIAVLEAEARRDPNAQIRRRLAELEQQRNRLNAQLQEKMQGLIEPKQMARVLEAVLTRQTDLKLIRVRNLPTRPLLKAEQGKGKKAAGKGPGRKPDVGVYRHGLQIEFEGSYLSTLEYLKALDALPYEFYWDELNLTVDKYPVSRIVITVHTLSLREGWIGV
jgi:MSHA biogenesis protein MshJ